MDSEQIEIRLLLEAIKLKYGFDFLDYAGAHLKRRIRRRMHLEEHANVAEMLHRVLQDETFLEVLLADFSINVTEMFRDPGFYRALRTQVLPQLAAMDFFKVWHAGCASGEEVYSLAILLKEEGLYDHAQIYATDYNEKIIQKARDGIFPLQAMRQYTINYQNAGGHNAFSDYYHAQYDSARMDPSLKKNVLFAEHNLVQDSVFGEMDLIVCRNVLIYFNQKLQGKVVKLFLDSLSPGGFLGLGSKESLRFSGHASRFEPVAVKEKIYRLNQQG
jgi:chemotaxis protein methyltransferase CheR